MTNTEEYPCPHCGAGIDEETLREMYLGLVSIRRGEKVTMTIDGAMNLLAPKWGGEGDYTGKELVKEIARGLKSQYGEPESFDCRRCGKTFTPKKGQWIFYNLCDDCFLPFDVQKMRGRFSGLGGKEPIPYFESVEGWLEDEVQRQKRVLEFKLPENFLDEDPCE